MRDARRPTSRTCWVLLIIFVGLQVADIASTNYALTIPGVREINPLMAFAQAKLGALWWLPKLVAAGVISRAAFSLQRRWPMVFAVSVSGFPVLANLAHF
jgi:hypothetical protein